MSKNMSDRLVEAVMAWAAVPGEHDTPEWRTWNSTWVEASCTDRREALVKLALYLVMASREAVAS